MNTAEDNGALSASEEAYFNSRGETEVTVVEEEKPGVAEAPVVVEEENIDPDIPAVERDAKGKFVPHGALHAEREEHKKTREELRKVAERQAVLDDRWNTMLQAAKSQETAVQPVAPPDPNEDIFAYSKWQKEQFEALNAKVTARETAELQAKQQGEQEQAIWGHWNKSIETFSAATPDFSDAAKHLLDLRTTQLKALGLDKAAIDQTIDTEVKGVVIQAANANKSPAQIIYEYAKASGYSGPKPADIIPPPVNGELPDKLAGIQAAQSASRSVAASAGGGAPDPDSAEAILAMNEREFSAWMTKPGSQEAFRKMAGG